MFKPISRASMTSGSSGSGGHAQVSPLIISTPLESLPMLEPSTIEPESSRSIAPHKTRVLRGVHVFMNLLMSVIGAGMLSLPFTFVVVPTAQAITMVVVVGASMGLTAHALLYAHAHVAQNDEIATLVGAGRNVASYRSMGIRVAGVAFGNAVSVVMAIGIFGGCVGGIRIVRDMMPHMSSLLYELFASTSYEKLTLASKATIETALLWSIFGLIVFPLCSLKSLSGLKIPNYLGFVFSVLLVAAVMYRSCSMPRSTPSSARPATVRTLTAMSTPSPTTAAKLAVINVGSHFDRFAQSVSIYSYAFTMHLNLLPLFVQLRGNFESPIKQSATRMTQCVAGVTALCMAVYIAFGVFASRLYGATIQGNILVNMQSDTFMQIPLVAVFLTVLLSFPPLFHPGRIIVEELIHNKPAADLSWKSRSITAVVLLLGELLVAIWVPGIEVVFALVGASTTVLICYVFPVVMFTKLYPWRACGVRGWLWCALLWLIVAFVASMGVHTIVFLLSDK